MQSLIGDIYVLDSTGRLLQASGKSHLAVHCLWMVLITARLYSKAGSRKGRKMKAAVQEAQWAFSEL